MTQDSDLGPFDSHSIGLKLVLYAGDVTIDAAVDYVFRSDGIDQIIGASGVRLSF